MTPEGWRAVKLAELLDGIDAGWSPQCVSQAASPDTWGVLKLSAVTSGRFLDTENKALPENQQPRPNLEVRVGDLLLARANGVIDLVGRTALVRRTRPKLMISDKVLRLRPRNGVALAEFLHVLFSFGPVRQALTTVTDGSHMRNVSQSSLREIGVICPPLWEQRKIAAILSAVDDAIEATQAVIDQLQVVKNAMMAELLTRGLPGRHTRFRQTEIGEVPESWRVVPIGNLLDESAYGTSAKCDVDGDGLPVLRIPNVATERISTDDLKYARLSEANVERYRLQAGDLLVIRTNGNPSYVGRSAVVPELDGTWLYASYLIRLRLKLDLVRPLFLHEAMRAERTRKTMQGAIRTSAGNYNLNTRGIAQALVPLPPPAEQDEISAVADLLHAGLDAEVAALESLRDTKTALISVLLTGEVRVTPDEVAA